MRTLIRNGVVYDGTGAPGFAADVLVQDDTIEAVAPELDAEADEVLDAAGMAVTPGFIDTHRHCDTAALTDPDFGRIETAQGLTTIIGGNCGLAPLPVRPETARQISDYIEPCLGPTPESMQMAHFPEYLDALDKTDKPLNIGSYVGIGTLRACVKGYGRAPFTPAELDWARGYISEAMQAGAVGLTTGIMYQPECYSSRKEFVSLVSAAAPYGRVLATHIRGEGDNLVPSVAEVIEIAKEAGVPLNISHFKVTGVKNWGKNILEAIDLIEKARAAGQDVTADFYPYDGGSTTLVSLLPPTLMKDTMAETLAALSTAQGRADARREIYADHPGWDNMVTAIGWERIVISSVTKPENRRFSNMNFAAAAKLAGYDEPTDFMCELLCDEDGKVGIILLSMDPKDVDTIAKLPWSMIISDSLYGISDCPHPRLYGSFPKVLRDFVRERGVLTLPQAIHKMTAMPAARLGLNDRGVIEVGRKADIAVFDPASIADHATYDNPKQLCTGLRATLINGKIAVENDTLRRRDCGITIKK